MSVRTALRQSKVVTFFVLLLGLWVVVAGINVFNITRISLTVGEVVGQTAVGGVIGLLVIAVVLGLLVALYGGLSETTPTPDTWPPE